MRIWLQWTRVLLYQATAIDLFKIPANTPMSVKQAFLMGTRNGGLALRRPDLGVLQAGATADVVVFSTDAIGLIGWKDPIAAVVLHSNVADIESIYVGGGIVKRNGSLVTDWVGQGFKARLQASAERWDRTLATTNLTAFQAGIGDPVPSDFVNPLEVDVTPGPSTGF